MAWDVASGWSLLVMVGFAAGVLSSGLGVGSGIIVVPALVLLLACPQKSAQGMALALMVPMAALGVFQYLRMPGVRLEPQPILLLMAGAVLGVWVGARVMARVPDVWLQRAFAVFLVVVACRMLLPSKANRPGRAAAAPAAQQPKETGSQP